MDAEGEIGLMGQSWEKVCRNGIVFKIMEEKAEWKYGGNLEVSYVCVMGE